MATGDLSFNFEPAHAKIAHDSDVDVDAAKAASEAAFIRVMEFEANSNLLRRADGDNYEVTRLDWDDVCVEGLLGVGGFACVCKVSVPMLEVDNEEDPADDDEKDENKSSKSGTSSSSAGAGIFALKCLNERTTMDPQVFATGAADLASEFLMLSHLRHDNIVRIYGVSNGCVSQAFQESGGYFLLLECLRGTVADLLRLWREDMREPSKAAKIPSPLERLKGISLGVCRGMEYLHQNNVIYRDLKPHNIGFDREGNPRIFDFGLARELVVDSTTTNPSIPGVAGSWRYMAPEVALGNGSVFASDVFSFGMVTWELLTLEKPFARVDCADEFKQKVAIKGQRPPLTDLPTAELKTMIKSCWEVDPAARPSFTEVCKYVEMEMIVNAEELKQTKQGKKATWKEQFANLKKSVKQQIRERRRSSQQ